MSPPFHTNLMLGLRFLQASLLLPLHRNGSFSSRAIPIRFEEVSTVKKPGKRGSEEAWQQYRQDQKRFNLSQRFVQTMTQLRAALDQAGGAKKTLVIAGDGSFCNRTVLATIPERSTLIARTRKDANCVSPQLRVAAACMLKTSSLPRTFTRSKRFPGSPPKCFMAVSAARVRYKEIARVLWQSGAKTRPLRLFVIAPTPYRKRKSAKLYYRQPAFLLCTDLTSSPRQLLQIYFDRWQIEVNHREEKTLWALARPSFGIPLPFPDSPFSPWPPTAL